uniref:Uncharacterized protein n=1 Tax=Arundo donax TaxID=35708 RepID=A0A0A9EWI9_ARUDO
MALDKVQRTVILRIGVVLQAEKIALLLHTTFFFHK